MQTSWHLPRSPAMPYGLLPAAGRQRVYTSKSLVLLMLSLDATRWEAHGKLGSPWTPSLAPELAASWCAAPRLRADEHRDFLIARRGRDRIERPGGCPARHPPRGSHPAGAIPGLGSRQPAVDPLGNPQCEVSRRCLEVSPMRFSARSVGYSGQRDLLSAALIRPPPRAVRRRTIPRHRCCLAVALQRARPARERRHAQLWVLTDSRISWLVGSGFILRHKMAT